MKPAADVIDEIIEAHRADKNGDLLIKELGRLYSMQSEVGKKQYLGVIRGWLQTGDAIRADWAIALIRELQIFEELQLLRDTLEDIREGRSSLPEYFTQFLLPAIRDLETKNKPA